MAFARKQVAEKVSSEEFALEVVEIDTTLHYMKLDGELYFVARPGNTFHIPPDISRLYFIS